MNPLFCSFFLETKDAPILAGGWSMLGLRRNSGELWLQDSSAQEVLRQELLWHYFITMLYYK